jgi:hypothetical protein
VSLRREEEVKERGQGASPTTGELGRRQWRGGRRSNSVAKAVMAREGVGVWECAKGGYGGALGRLYRLGWRKEAVPRRPWPSMAGLDGKLRGEGGLRG